MSRVVIDLGGDTPHGREQMKVLELLARQADGKPIVLSTTGVNGSGGAASFNFVVTLRLREEVGAAAG